MTRPTSFPTWQKAAIAFSGTGVALMLLATLSWGRTILIPMAVAVFLSFVLSPVVRLLVRCRIPHAAAVIVTTFFAALLAIGVAWALTQQLASLTMTLPDNKDRIVRKVAAMKAWVSGGNADRLGQLVDEIESTMNPKSEAQGETISMPVSTKVQSAGWSGWVERFVSPAAEGLGQCGFAVVLVIFLLLKKEDLRDRFIRLIGDGRVTTTTKALNDASERVSRFLFKQFLFNLAFGAAVTIGLLLLGVQYALLWGAMAAGMRYLPYIGTWISVIPPTVYTLAVTDAWWPPIGVLVFVLTLELVSNNLIEPFLYGHSLGVSEVAQLVAAGFWSFLWGPIGLVLSGPLTTCLLVLGKYVPGLKFLDVLLGNEPSLDRGVMFFQRVTAKDDDAAARLFSQTLAADGAVIATDVIIIPALQLVKTAERDGELATTDVERCLATVREIAEEIPKEEAPLSPAGTLPRLLIIPARDEVDAVACDLLARLFPAEKWDVKVAATATLTGELVDQIGTLTPDLVVVGSVLPGGIAHSRYVTKRIHSKHPDLTLVVGRWGTGEVIADIDSAEPTAGVTTTSTLAETTNLVMGWRPTVVNEGKNDVAFPKPSERAFALQTSGTPS